MSRPRTTAGKRNVQQAKREKAQAKQERKAARQLGADEAPAAPVEATEAELIEQLATLHRAVEAGQVSHQDFEDRRDTIRQQLEQIERLG